MKHKLPFSKDLLKIGQTKQTNIENDQMAWISKKLFHLFCTLMYIDVIKIAILASLPSQMIQGMGLTRSNGKLGTGSPLPGPRLARVE